MEFNKKDVWDGVTMERKSYLLFDDLNARHQSRRWEGIRDSGNLDAFGRRCGRVVIATDVL